jgi:hypothetical protein
VDPISKWTQVDDVYVSVVLDLVVVNLVLMMSMYQLWWIYFL